MVVNILKFKYNNSKLVYISPEYEAFNKKSICRFADLNLTSQYRLSYNNIRLPHWVYLNVKDLKLKSSDPNIWENNDAKNIFDLDLNTSKQESIVSKDKKGNATSYKLVLTVDVFFTNKINNKNYQKKFIPY